MPIVEAITVGRGEDITLHMTETPNKDITGWVISFTASKAANKQAKLFQVTATVTDGPNSKYDIILLSSQLDREPATYFYDIFRVNPGNLRLMREGDLIIDADAKFPL